jgi:uncharacterized protein YydD (DUF2326 family)
MRLIKVSANQPGFKTVHFNKTGLSLIVGVRTAAGETDTTDERSYNGVGKSLLAEIIHFCLGSNTNEAFQNQLIDWEFSLDFEIGDTHFVATRATGKQNEILLNGKSYKLKPFNEKMGKMVFATPDIDTGQLSFRVLIPRFIRRGKADYIDPKFTSSDREPYTTLLRNLFLLGLEIGLVEKKYQLRCRQTEIAEFEKNFKKDPFIREYYTGNKDATLQAKHLEEQIHRLETDLSQFQVAEDFYDIEREANRLHKELRELKNRKLVIENALHNIEKTLQARTDFSREKILTLYTELMSAFKEETLKRLTDVELFHEQLIQNRVARLGQERMKLTVELQQTSETIKKINAEVDSKLAYLSDKRALDQYVAVSSQRSELLGKLHKLQDYQKLLQKSRDDLVHIRRDFAEETIKSNLYLQDTEIERNKQISMFAELSKKFYPEAPAGITIDNNQGENKVRFDFDVRIEADGSDGINSIKIFCYDLAILLLGSNHNVEFIWHDSRLFSDVDPRQLAPLFKVADQFTRERGKQYIATVNQHQLDTLRTEFSDDEFRNLFESQNIVLRLKDDGPESKLLGIQVDMYYH